MQNRPGGWKETAWFVRARRIVRFAGLYVFCRNRFSRVLANLREFARMLDDRGVESFVAGGFLVSLLEGRQCRRFKDVDLNVDERERVRLLEILAGLGVAVRVKWTGNVSFVWRGVPYDVIFFRRAVDRCIFEYKPHQLTLDVPAAALTDDRFCPAAFAAYGIRILNPAIVFGFVYLARKATHYKKKDLYCLNRRVPRERRLEIAAANPRLGDDPDFLDWKYSYGAWLKDELFGISPPARRARP